MDNELLSIGITDVSLTDISEPEIESMDGGAESEGESETETTEGAESEDEEATETPVEESTEAPVLGIFSNIFYRPNSADFVL